MSWLAGLWREHRVAAIVVCMLAAAGLAVTFIWPFTDLIAAHDVGLIKGSQRAVQLQAAREAARTQMLTFGAGVLAAGALVFTAWNVTLYRSNLGLYRRTNEITEQGQVTDRFTKAIEQLGSDKFDVRLGGIYALERIARDSASDHPVVMEVLSAFIREHSRDERPSGSGGEADEHEPKMRSDVQAAVTVIGRRDPKRDIRWIDLSGADLSGAFLVNADLTKVSLFRADLSDANLTRANLTSAELVAAKLSGADLEYANLVDADLTDADLSYAHLSKARWPMHAEVPQGWKRNTGGVLEYERSGE